MNLDRNSSSSLDVDANSETLILPPSAIPKNGDTESRSATPISRITTTPSLTAAKRVYPSGGGQNIEYFDIKALSDMLEAISVPELDGEDQASRLSGREVIELLARLQELNQYVEQAHRSACLMFQPINQSKAELSRYWPRFNEFCAHWSLKGVEENRLRSARVKAKTPEEARGLDLFILRKGLELCRRDIRILSRWENPPKESQLTRLFHRFLRHGWYRSRQLLGLLDCNGGV